jgi:cytolysin-activating lysine-acyltransferase
MTVMQNMSQHANGEITGFSSNKEPSLINGSNSNVAGKYGENERFKCQQIGEVCLVLSRSPHYARMPLRHLGERFIYPMSIGQGRIFKDRNGKPFGILSYAWLSDELSEKMKQQGPFELRPEDWNSGGNLWFMEFAAPYGGTRKMTRVMHDFVRDTFPDVQFVLAHRVKNQGRDIRVAKFHIIRN